MCSASGADAAITAITAILTGAGVMYSSIGSSASCVAARRREARHRRGTDAVHHGSWCDADHCRHRERFSGRAVDLRSLQQRLDCCPRSAQRLSRSRSLRGRSRLSCLHWCAAPHWCSALQWCFAPQLRLWIETAGNSSAHGTFLKAAP